VRNPAAGCLGYGARASAMLSSSRMLARWAVVCLLSAITLPGAHGGAGARFRARYLVDSKSWSTPVGDTHNLRAAAELLEPFTPPIFEENHGFRCYVNLEAVKREVWGADEPLLHTAGGDDAHPAPADGHWPIRGAVNGPTGRRAPYSNSWLMKGQLEACSYTRSHFHGPYVAASPGKGQDDPLLMLAPTPFFFVHTDDGRIRQFYFFGNETLVTRNFKRGMLSFANLVTDLPEAKSRVVDLDEHGVCVTFVVFWQCGALQMHFFFLMCDAKCGQVFCSIFQAANNSWAPCGAEIVS